MRAFVELLNRILALLESALRRRENQRHQDEAKQIESDPCDWFADHFDGMPDKRAADDADAPGADPDAKS